ncbi:MAG: FAD-binding oxidoreductase [Blastocatellia bacterium]|nr:FAD-binding oxidoreductase [Blastocatellia bacterium]
MNRQARIVIVGAGIAGIATAYHLVENQGMTDVTVIDERSPLTLTSDKGTGCFRNWWPGPDSTMVNLMNRSIELLEDLARKSDNVFGMNQRGYAFLTGRPAEAARMVAEAEEISGLGAGRLRHVESLADYRFSEPEGGGPFMDGADYIDNPGLIRQIFPDATSEAKAALHVRRCGCLTAKPMGLWMLERILARGARLMTATVAGFEVAQNQIRAIRLAAGERVGADVCIIAAGPHLRKIGNMLGLHLPLVNEKHGKITLSDSKKIIQGQLPLLIWNDPVYLAWNEQEKAALTDLEYQFLSQEFPAGVHARTRKSGEGQEILIIWTYDHHQQLDYSPPVFDKFYGEVLIRGLAHLIPAMKAYFGKGPEVWVDGGYYCKTPENRPLIGPTSIDGCYVIGALSGYGVMASQAAGELISLHLAGKELPKYAEMFYLSRYESKEYQNLISKLGQKAGQL